MVDPFEKYSFWVDIIGKRKISLKVVTKHNIDMETKNLFAYILYAH